MRKVQSNQLVYQAKLQLARLSFWEYCKLKAPDFYKEGREYLKTFCNTLQDFYYSDKKVLVVNMPPRHGKSRTAQLFVGWVLGKSPSEKIMTGSYNETLSTTFSRGVRNDIQERKADADRVVYKEIFPNNRIKRGDGAANLWSLEGQHANYLATSPSGTATGFGASLLIIDDLIKNAEEANNETVLENHFEWFTNTMLSRLEAGGKVIVIMTRWHSADLAGRILDHYGKVNPDALVHVNMPTPLPDGSMLCDEVLNREDYEDKARMMGKDIVLANYGQHPIDLQGRLYTHFKTYDDIPREKPVGDAEVGEPAFFEIKNYTDTADKGEDYLCSITYGVYHSECYILDVIYTKEPMEVTEPLVAKHLHDYGVQVADIESNNGGRGFGRSVQRIMYEKYHSNRVHFNLFYQSKNKIARILSNATWCMNHIYFPADWQTKHPEFYEALYKYQKEGKNKHDDAPDALTGLAEKVGRGNLYSFS